MKLLVDADGCPKGALQACLKEGKKRRIEVWTVANYHHRIESDHHITVDGGSQEADMKVMNLAEAGDVVVTQDWGLAALILGKGARCLHPSGKEYRHETIDFLLEEREMKAKIRRSGGRTKGPSKRTDAENRRFHEALVKLLDENGKEVD